MCKQKHHTDDLLKRRAGRRLVGIMQPKNLAGTTDIHITGFSNMTSTLFVESPYAAVLGVFHLESGSSQLVAYAVACGPVFLGLCLCP